MTPTYQPARVWEEPITIPTYPVPPPDLNPMFFEKRVNQGASGHVYPNPFTDRVNHETKVAQTYQAVFLENEYIQVMVMPQFGGRIHTALDKTNGYDFIYRQNVIKPNLIGLFGSWISGGMEFNWHLHHRPSTFMPVEYRLEQGVDGSATVWLSEHEPMNRMKGMLGVCIYPGKAYFELKVQLYNRTALPHPILWWINCAASVNDSYQVIFPPDVENVAFHSRADMASYPIAHEYYAGCDWRNGVDISFPNNVQQATSYFANPSKYDFFGGFDHGKQAGIIHVANHHISPGKKCFLWGTSDFGSAWQKSLTDNDGPYIELMASSYSDNQPDFSWLQPYETKTFRHIWYPIQQIGSVKNANAQVAVNLENNFIGVCSTETILNAQVLIMAGEQTLLHWHGDLLPGKPFTANQSFDLQSSTTLKVLDSANNELISYTPLPRRNEPLPETAKPPKLPHKIDSLEELYLTGLHVEQYLHFSLDPALYWERALTLDPGDSRNNNSLGRLKLRRGDFAGAETHFRTAIKTLTRYNFNPYDGEAYYNLGLALVYQDRFAESYDAFYKSICSSACQAPGYYALAQINTRHSDFASALEHIDRSLVANAHHNQALALKCAVLRRMGRLESALETARDAVKLDPLNHWATCELMLALEALGDSNHDQQIELNRLLRGNAQNYLDLAFDYSNSGLYAEATDILVAFIHLDNPSSAPQSTVDYPIVYYALGYFASRMDDVTSTLDWFQQAANQPSDWCFPQRSEEQIILESARVFNPADGRAAYYLGNLYYDKKQHEKAIAAWQVATQLEPGFSIPWRNLSIALHNKRGDKDGARHCYQQALTANPNDPRQIMEYDQLTRCLGVAPIDRLLALENQLDAVEARDDLTVGLAALYNQTDQPKKALHVLLKHQFHPWEGGEGQSATQYALANVLIGEMVLKSDPFKALEHFNAARLHPVNLGVGRAAQDVQALIEYRMAEVNVSLGQREAAETHFRNVLTFETVGPAQPLISPLSYYCALALRQLGDEDGAKTRLQFLLDQATANLNTQDDGGFFTSVPAAIIFDEEPGRASRISNQYLIGLAHKGLGHTAEERATFEAVLALDPYHWEARSEL